MNLKPNVRDDLSSIVNMGNDIMSYMNLRTLLESLEDSDPQKQIVEEIIYKMAKLIEIANT